VYRAIGCRRERDGQQRNRPPARNRVKSWHQKGYPHGKNQYSCHSVDASPVLFQRGRDEVLEQADRPQLRQMATTFSAVYIVGHKMRLVHCGDTRIVLQRRNGIKLLTEDHTEAQRLLSTGRISPGEFDRYPRKNVLESALGGPTQPKIDSASLDVLPGDRVFIMSDGVHGKALLRELKEVSDRSRTASVFVQGVADLVRQRGADDNYTIAAAFCANN
jgi:PPM family protein phosphatase